MKKFLLLFLAFLVSASVAFADEVAVHNSAAGLGNTLSEKSTSASTPDTSVGSAVSGQSAGLGSTVSNK